MATPVSGVVVDRFLPGKRTVGRVGRENGAAGEETVRIEGRLVVDLAEDGVRVDRLLTLAEIIDRRWLFPIEGTGCRADPGWVRSVSMRMYLAKRVKGRSSFFSLIELKGDILGQRRPRFRPGSAGFVTRVKRDGAVGGLRGHAEIGNEFRLGEGDEVALLAREHRPARRHIVIQPGGGRFGRHVGLVGGIVEEEDSTRRADGRGSSDIPGVAGRPDRCLRRRRDWCRQPRRTGLATRSSYVWPFL